MNQKKSGIFLSYATLFSSSILSILITPFMLRQLGDIEYGLYQSISSFVGVLAILDFGTGITTTKYIASYRLKNDKKGEENYLAIQFIINLAVSAIITVAGMFVVRSVDSIFSGQFGPEDIQKARILALLYIVNIVITIFANWAHGMLSGCQKFATANGLNLIKILIRYGLIYILLKCNLGSIAISIADIFAGLLFLLIAFGYAGSKLNIRIKLTKWDRTLFLSTFTFSAALLIQTIVNQLNNSIDKVLLGSILGGTAVTVYSIGMSIYLIYGSLSGAVRNVFLPEAVSLIEKNATGSEITDFVIRGGRFQCSVLSFILFGFLLVGKEFISMWVGNEYQTAWYISLTLMIPMMFQLSISVTESVLDAMGKRLIRSVILLIGAGINFLVTIIFINNFGVIGAPVATGLSCVVINMILVIYYHKIMGLQIGRMCRQIFLKAILCGTAASVLPLLVDQINVPVFLSFLLKGVIFTCLYGLLLWRFVWDKNIKKAWNI